MAVKIINNHKIPRMNIIVPTILLVLINESRPKPLHKKENIWWKKYFYISERNQDVLKLYFSKANNQHFNDKLSNRAMFRIDNWKMMYVRRYTGKIWDISCVAFISVQEHGRWVIFLSEDATFNNQSKLHKQIFLTIFLLSSYFHWLHIFT